MVWTADSDGGGFPSSSLGRIFVGRILDVVTVPDSVTRSHRQLQHRPAGQARPGRAQRGAQYAEHFRGASACSHKTPAGSEALNGVPVNGSLYLYITGNSVNSAAGEVFLLVEDPS